MGNGSIPIAHFFFKELIMNIYSILKKSFPILVLILTISNSGSAQFIKMNLGIADDATTASPVTFGVHQDATDGRDISLNENELPAGGLGFPPNLFAAFRWPNSEEIQLSYEDYRKRSDSATFKRMYRLEFGPSRKGKAKIIWTYPLPPGIDSVRIVDRRSNGINVNFLLDNAQQFIIQNEFWDSFLLYAYFNNSTVRVSESHEQILSPVFYAGHFISSVALPKTQDGVNNVQIINIMGQICAEMTINLGSAINLPDNMAQGTYFLLSKNSNNAKTDVKTISIW